MPGDELSLRDARRIALAAQGFDRPRPARVDSRQIRRVVRQIGLLQIDYVNVLGPAHYHVLFSRLGPYPNARLDELVYRKHEFTEQWAHEASIVPVETWPLLRHRMETFGVRSRSLAPLLREHADYFEGVLGEIRRRGPLCADDLTPPPGVSSRLDGWIGTVERGVLETHFGRGALASAGRLPNFARIYDLAERIVPEEHHRREVPREDAERELVERAALAYGIATVADLADYFRMSVPRTRARVGELVEAGRLQPIRVRGWRDGAFLHCKAPAPKSIRASALLSPFDPLIWFRDRAARLFDFDYRIEIFFPKAKRRWGYYVLPFLHGDRLVARVDLKAERKQGRLEVLSAYREPHAKPGPTARALARELHTLAGWHGLDGVRVGRRGDFARELTAAVRR